MHVLLVSVGTDGDIIPYVGLGAALRARGHRVTLAAGELYEPLARRQGLAFAPLVTTAEHKELFEHPDFWNPMKNAPLMARWGVRLMPRQYDLLSTLVPPGTVLVANPGILAAGLIHERFGVPWTNLVLQPWMIPSTLAPPLLPGFTWLARAPRPAWQVFSYGLELVVDLLVGRDLNRLRARIGLPPTRRVIRHWLSKELVIGMFPEWFGLTQADWPSQVRLAGFPLFDGGQADALPGDVLEFCRAGAPPVAFTFGTGMAHPAHLFRAAVEACEILGVRGILLTKYRDQLPDPLPASVLPCAFAPFQELFPRCAAVLHHGGIGTTAKALASGTPQLVHPLCFDQIDNGMRVQRLGVGVCLRVRRPSGRQIATALAPLMTEEFRATARRLKARFQGADALVAAAELVESLAPHSVPSDVSRI